MIAQIVFPPQFEPFQPYLSGPYLKGWLQDHGIATRVFDANVDFFNWLVVQGRCSDPYLAMHAADALKALRRSPENLLSYRWAVNVLDRFLEAVAAGSGRLGLNRFEIEDRFSSDALRIWAGEDALFREYFEHAQRDILGEEGVSCYLFSVVVMDQLGPAVVLAREIRKRRPKARILVGGPLISRLHRQLLGLAWLSEVFDALVPGEAYAALPALLGLPVTQGYSGHVTPDFSDCDWNSYWSCRRVLPYLVAHGCKWGKCTFCSHHLTYEGYRSSGMEAVLADLEQLSVAHGAEYVSFCDEYLTPRQLTDLASGLVDRSLDLKWLTFARPEPAFKNCEWSASLYDGGCRMLMFGLESGSQRILSAMRKGTRVDNFTPILQSCAAARIAIRYDFMVGFPGETIEDVRATYDFIRTNRDLIDTPFSSYSVAAFELRSGVPVEQARDQFGIAGAELLRGDLDDQYEFAAERGLCETERAEWRDRFIRYAKEELAFDIISPQNKTHQLILKDLYDRKEFALPPGGVATANACALRAKFADWVTFQSGPEGFELCNLATGGSLELSANLADIIEHLRIGGSLVDAVSLRRETDANLLLRLLNFLYRNDYLLVEEDNAASVEQLEAIHA